MTDGHDWAEVDRLLDCALDLAPENRAAFIDTAADGDPALHDRLTRLVAAADAPDDALADLARRVGETLGDAVAPEPKQVGAYRLGEKLGHGGTGAVYRAERDLGAATQTVALKVIRPELLPLASPETLARFEQERGLLSRLEHPHIAHLIDGGETPDGTPFLAMEYVDGTPITEFCARESLSLRERIRLVQDAARAVAFAHRKLVIHRDIKPSNLLVARAADGHAVPKLIDFGIGKLLSVVPMASPLTVPGHRLLTPEYAAPEQLRDGDVGTAADVYALGGILYEVLSGARPFDADTPRDLERLVCEVEPPPPSTRATAGGVAASDLRGDLDRICLEALRKEPERRYSSASELADDLDRYLLGHPVRARDATARYRTGKFVRRNRAALAAVAAVILALAVGLGAALWQAGVAADERDRATAAATRAEQASEFLAGLLELGDPFEAPVPTPSSALADSGLIFLRRDAGMDPVLKADVALRLADVFEGQGRYSEQEAAARLAVDSLNGTDAPPELRARAESVHSHALFSIGRPAAAVAAARRATAHVERGPVPDAVAVDVAVQFGRSLSLNGETDEAVEVLRQAVARFADAPNVEPIQRLKLLDSYAGRLDAAGRFDEAVEAGARAFALSREVLGTQSARAQITPYNYALTLISARRFAEAEALLTEVVRREGITLGADHPSRAITRTNLADVELRTGRIREAAAQAAEAAAVLEAAAGDGATVAVQARTIEAVALSRLGRHREAEALFVRLLALDEQTLPASPRTQTEYLHSIALRLAGRARDAEALRRKAVITMDRADRAILDEMFGRDGSRTDGG